MKAKPSKKTILSMTGYGSGEAEEKGIEVRCELRSYNFRGLDIKVHLPRDVAFLEPLLITESKNALHRGKIELSLKINGQERNIGVSRFRAESAKLLIDDLAEFGRENRGIVKLEINLGQLLAMPELFVTEISDEFGMVIKKASLSALKKALSALVRSRAAEGKVTGQLMALSMIEARRNLEIIEGLAHAWPKKRQELLKQRLENLLADKVDEVRVIQEAAILAEKSDISEEIGRLYSHFDNFNDICLNQCTAVGKKLEFLGQEMLREANTIGSKCGDRDIIFHTVELKSEIDRIREHMQNIE